MGIINGNQRCCGTCEFWTGSRKLNNISEVQCDGPTAKCVGGGNNNTHIDASGSCNQYKKWSKLR